MVMMMMMMMINDKNTNILVLLLSIANFRSFFSFRLLFNIMTTENKKEHKKKPSKDEISQTCFSKKKLSNMYLPKR